MANFDQLKQSVAALIRTNGAEEITGQIMQDVLLTIINSISGGYMFGGVAQHSGNVGNPDYNVFYLAGSGAYTGYGDAINIPDGCYGVFRYNGSWTQDVVDIGVHLTGTISAGETNGVTGDVINTALQQLFNNIMNILDTLTFTYNTPSGQQATKAMLDVIVTPTGGASHVLTTLTLVSATAAAAGLMSAEDKQKVDRMLTDFRSLSFSDTTAVADQATKIVQTLSATLGENPEAITTMTFLAATASKAGLLSAADKAKLDALWSSGYQFVGIATPSTTPISTTSKIFYIATEAGTYFNAVTVTQGINILSWNGTAWSAVQVVGMADDTNMGLMSSEDKEALSHVDDLELSDRTHVTGSSLEVTDEDGNVIVVFKDGHIETKYFNSLHTVGKGNEIRGQLSITDDNGNAVVIFKDGHIMTRMFNSKETLKDVDFPLAQFAISDERGNPVVVFKDGHIRTKNFNSANIPSGLNDLPYPFLDKFKGKTLGIIGDSISTFQGWLPSDIPGYDGSTYAVYYPHGTLTMVQQTWWYKVATQLRISPEHISNCSWSGSRVSGNSTSTTSAGAACSTRRISDLTLRGFTPDIIICFISCNDWGNTPNVPIGDWKVTDPIPSEGTITEMRAAYALMLNKIHVAYPQSRVFCCTILDDFARDRTAGWPSNNYDGVSTHEWNENIIDVATALGCDVINLHRCGINYSNIAEYYAVDAGIHPNSAGHTLMARKIVAELFAKY